MKKLSVLLFAFITVLAFSSCEKEDDPQPDTTGVNTAITNTIPDTSTTTPERSFTTDPVTPMADYHSETFTGSENYERIAVSVLDNDNITPTEFLKHTSSSLNALNKLGVISSSMTFNGQQATMSEYFHTSTNSGTIDGDYCFLYIDRNYNASNTIESGVYVIEVEYQYYIHQAGLGDYNRASYSATAYITMTMQ